MRLVFVVLAFLLVCWPAAADQSISELPKHIVAPPGKVSLIADFDHPTTSPDYAWKPATLLVPVYLINRTETKLELAAQGDDVYLKLEYRDPAGHWKRAQSHQYSFCGNSYFYRPVVAPGQFMVIEGYEPLQGEKSEIRFRLYEQSIEVASNIGKGLVKPEDIQKAANDVMAVRTGDLEFVTSVATGRRILQNNLAPIRGPELQRDAMRELSSGRFDETRVRGVLKQIIDANKQPFSSWAGDELFQLDQKAAATEKPEK